MTALYFAPVWPRTSQNRSRTELGQLTECGSTAGSSTVWSASAEHSSFALVLSSRLSSLLPPGLSAAERKFADSLNHFRFQCIGDAETDHEMCIGGFRLGFSF